MKKIAIVFILAFYSMSVKGQGKIVNLGVGPGLSFPSGHFGDIANVGTGIGLLGSVAMTDNFRLFSHIGFRYFFANNASPSYSFFPCLIGGEYVQGSFVVGAGLGYGIFLRSKYIVGNVYSQGIVNSSSDGGFSYSPHLGYTSHWVDFLVHFNNTSLKWVSFSDFGATVYFKFFSNEK